ncbi:acyltransferase [Enterobacter kobei]|uniref:acyltransferase family protein n=1 Tax=Enterobacter kobei TaxID=208224 RepID=UPI002FF4F805
MNDKKNEIQSIAFLRGVACIFVALYHLKSSAPGDSVFYNLFKFGAFGVDLFFMISGFVIVIATMNDKTVDSFFIKRIFRIYPPLIAAVLLQVFISKSEVSFSEFMSAIVPLHNDYTAKAPDFGFSFLIVAWSITFELAFYALFMASIVISHRYRALVCSTLILAIVIGTQLYYNGSFSLMQAGASPEINNSNLRFIRVFGCSIMIEFILGMAIAYVYMNVRVDTSSLVTRRAFTILTVLSLMYLIPCYLGGYNRGSGLAGYGVWALLILFIALGGEKLNMFRWNKSILFVGAISYSLYLFHIPVHELIKQIIPDKLSQIKNIELRAVCVMMLELSASMLVAYLSFLFIEKPCIKLARKIIEFRSRWPSMA